jgi:tryptophan synthase alpha chain
MAIEFKSRSGLVVYLTAGDPSLAETEAIALAAIDAGADVIELGVPFSDPLADGPVIQRASERALKHAPGQHGTRLIDVLEIARKLRAARPKVGLVIFSYINPILRLGMREFCRRAAEAGADGVLVTDLIVEEADEYLAAVKEFHLAPIFLAAPTSPDARLKAIADVSQGFVYAISRTGITGTQQKVASDAAELVTRLRKFTSLPIAVGFGISNAEHVAAVGTFADAAVIGSAIVSIVEKSAPGQAAAAVGKFVEGLRTAESVKASTAVVAK